MTKEIPDVDGAFRTNVRNQIIKGIKKTYPDTELQFDEGDESYIKLITDQVMCFQNPELTEEQRKFMITMTIKQAIDNLIDDSYHKAYGGLNE